MAFQARNLSVLAYANGFTLWHYVSDDPAGEVGGAGYFDPAGDMLRAGDVIIANAAMSAQPTASNLFVAASTPGSVSVSPVGAGE